MYSYKKIEGLRWKLCWLKNWRMWGFTPKSTGGWGVGGWGWGGVGRGWGVRDILSGEWSINDTIPLFPDSNTLWTPCTIRHCNHLKRIHFGPMFGIELDLAFYVSLVLTIWFMSVACIVSGSVAPCSRPRGTIMCQVALMNHSPLPHMVTCCPYALVTL